MLRPTKRSTQFSLLGLFLMMTVLAVAIARPEWYRALAFVWCLIFAVLAMYRIASAIKEKKS